MIASGSRYVFWLACEVRLVIGLFCALGFATTIGAAELRIESGRSERPNIIVFLTDDQGYADVGVYGSEDLRTPNMDRLAREGIRFTDFYAQPLCGPSRAALLTGSYPIRIAEPDNQKHPNTILDSAEYTLAELLRDAGYATAAIGKWHLAGDGDPWDYAPPPLPPGRPGGKGPFDPSLMPNAQGFDYFYGTPMHNGYTKDVDPRRFIVDMMRNGEVVESPTNVDLLTQRYTIEAVNFIRANSQRPFFVYLAHNMPHVSLGVSDAFRGRSKRGLYGDVIEELDWSLGEVIAELQRQGIDENTLIVFMSDNGPPLGALADKNGASAAPLRGGKYSNWEGGIRVPAMMRWPKAIPAGIVDRRVASSLDLFPTVATLAGASFVDGVSVDGHDLTPRLLGTEEEQKDYPFYLYLFNKLQGVRKGRWKLVLPRQENPSDMAWLGRYVDAVDTLQLFDMLIDPGESTNLASEHPEVVDALLTDIESARETLGDGKKIGTGVRPMVKKVYFGDLHVHTTLSLDALMFGDPLTLDAAYRYARGEKVERSSGATLQLETPLDFVAMTDHAEWLADFSYCTDASSDFFSDEYCSAVRSARAQEAMPALRNVFVTLDGRGERVPSDDPLARSATTKNRNVAKHPWQQIRDAAEHYNEPGRFSAFVGYEFTALSPLPEGVLGNRMLHRNVIFANNDVPDEALGANVLETPSRLLRWLQESCINTCDAVVIPHNTNYSGGVAFRRKPIVGNAPLSVDEQLQIRYERLVEIFQAKGASECLADPFTADEACAFELMHEPCSTSEPGFCARNSDMVRTGLKNGLLRHSETGFNIRKLGFVGGTDTHNGTAGDTQEDRFNGYMSEHDNNASKRLYGTEFPRAWNSIKKNPGGLTGVWAERNTRQAIFGALKRRETFATSGTRIRVQLFAASNELSCSSDGQSDTCAEKPEARVHMGGELNVGPETGSPHFTAVAHMDPNGAPLSKVQLVKGWVSNGRAFESVRDLVCSDERVPDAATLRCPQLSTQHLEDQCDWDPGTGNSILKADWSDPDFDASNPAFYYLRVLEIPTCRWSSWDARSLGVAVPPGTPRFIQERAWSSPIWTIPALEG